VAALLVGAVVTGAPAPARGAPPLSDRVVDYRITATLDPATHTVRGEVRALWRNAGSAPTRELKLHLYLNAFKNELSTFMVESRGQHRSQSMRKGGWGKIDVEALEVGPPGGPLQARPTTVDDTVMTVPLAAPVAPGERLQIVARFSSRMPHVFARTGYHGDFYLGGQWFPKLGVYEGSAWNAHQFHDTTEFYADFGSYDVELTVPGRFGVGASGLPVGEPRSQAGGLVTHHFRADDVHDFAWVAAPDLRQLVGHESGSEVVVLYTEGYERMARRHLAAAQLGLREFRRRLGRYPYARLTVVNPPPGADGAGGMEYPTFITTISRWWLPRGVTLPEAVTIHEFGHQYFYGLLASNEFEHAWMDEGMNTYVTGLVLDDIYGADRSNLELFGFRLGYFAALRSRYRRVAGLDKIEQPAWTYESSVGYAGHTYNKTALMMRTLEGMLGRPLMDRVMREYAQAWGFRHPQPADFVAQVEKTVREVGLVHKGLQPFLEQALNTSEVVDYAIAEVRSRPHRPPRGLFDGRQVESDKPVAGQFDSEVLLRRRGGFVMPMELEVAFADGTTQRERWDGRSRWHRVTYRARPELVEARLDPDGKVPLDVNLLDNERSLRPRRGPVTALAARVLGWAQLVLGLVGF
jgi:hypothetical protein